VHQVGHAEDALCRDVEVVEQVGIGAGRRRLRDRLVVVDVEGEADVDAAPLRLEQGAGDELRRRLLEIEVVEGEVERLLGAGEELGRQLGDLQRGLPSVRQGADVDVRRSREP
jgi:hypothetical protein